MRRALIALLFFFSWSCVGIASESVEPIATVWSIQAGRFQEPIPPYPYHQEEVVFHNSADQVTLAGTLTLPHTGGPFPVVVLLHGSRPFDRDCSHHGHKPFLVWADHLTRLGIAVLRFDKRSAGKSTGDYSSSTLENFAADALAAVEYLKSRDEINPAQIGFIGHSEGGMTAFLAASKSPDIAFLISLAAPCVNGEDLVAMQEPLLQRIDGVSEEMIEHCHRIRNHMIAILKEIPDRSIAEARLRELLTACFSMLNPYQKEIVQRYYGTLENQIEFCNSAWFRYYLTYDPMKVVPQVRIPVLALYGSLDFVVSVEQNLRRLAHTLAEMGHPDFTLLELPQLNHAFQTCYTGSVREEIEETIAPIVLNIVSDWIIQKNN